MDKDKWEGTLFEEVEGGYKGKECHLYIPTKDGWPVEIEVDEKGHEVYSPEHHKGNLAEFSYVCDEQHKYAPTYKLKIDDVETTWRVITPVIPLKPLWRYHVSRKQIEEYRRYLNVPIQNSYIRAEAKSFAERFWFLELGISVIIWLCLYRYLSFSGACIGLILFLRALFPHLCLLYYLGRLLARKKYSFIPETPPASPRRIKKLERYEKIEKMYQQDVDDLQEVLLRKYPRIDKIGYDIWGYAKEHILREFINGFKILVDRRNALLDADHRRESFWKDIEAYEFEIQVAQWFRDRGYTANATPKGNDGGVDVVLYDSDCNKYFVQCKQWRTRKVSRPDVQQLYGVIASDPKAKGGFFVALMGMTTDAWIFANKVGIKVYTLKDLVAANDTPICTPRKILDKKVHRLPLYAIAIGEVAILCECFISEEEALNQKSRAFGMRSHVVSHRNMYFIIACSPENYAYYQYLKQQGLIPGGVIHSAPNKTYRHRPRIRK